MTLRKKSFENIVGKGENAGNQHFLFFPQYFQPYPKKKKKKISIATFYVICKCFEFGLVQKLSFGKEQSQNVFSNINLKQEGHDGPVSLHWLIREIHSYQTLHYLGIALKHKTPYKD